MNTPKDNEFPKDKQFQDRETQSPELSAIPPTLMTPHEIVGKLEELVKFALECEKQGLAEGVSFVEIFQELQKIQVSMKLLNEYQKETMQILSDMATQEGVVVPDEGEALTEEDKRVISKLKSLTTVCEAVRERIHSEIVQNPEVQEEITKKIRDASSSEQRKQSRRKNKFRAMGQDGWKSI